MRGSLEQVQTKLGFNKSGIAEATSPATGFRVLLDARKIFDGGIGVYTRNILAACSELAQYTLLVNPGQQEQIARRKYPWYDRVDFLSDPSKIFSWDDYYKLASRIPQQHFDFYHNPYFTLPRGMKIPSIITIHDLIQITNPEKFYYPFAAKLMLGNNIKRSDAVLTVSQTSAKILKNSFLKQLKVEGKLSVIPNALSEDFTKPASRDTRLNAGAHYLLGVFSNLKPHKCLSELLSAFEQLKTQNGSVPKGLKLVLAGLGIADITKDSKLFSMVAKNPDIILLGKVSDSELASLYAGADALILSSKQEGFCLPVIQAHAQGTSVIARPVDAIKELISDQDYLASDFSEEALMEAVRKMYKEQDTFNHPELLEGLAEYQLECQSGKYISIYQNLFNRNNQNKHI